MNKSISREEREDLKKNCPKYFMLVRAIINELDPLSLVSGGAPDDEHDTLTALTLKLIVNDKTEEIRQLIIDSFEWYGYGESTVLDEYKEKFYKKIDEATKKIINLRKEYIEEMSGDS
ncbi:hypothetical protein YSY43_17790 [Paenibacillus sp. YSY-4.3]